MIKIEITVPVEIINEGKSAVYLAEAMSAIGYAQKDRQWTAVSARAVTTAGELLNKIRSAQEGVLDANEDLEAARTEAVEGIRTGIGEIIAAAEDAPKRQRGKPSEGRARRTKEEKAEDDAADAADAARIANGETVEAPASDDDGEDDIVEETIETATDDEATQAADAVDEAAESAAAQANKPADAITLNDLRTAMAELGQKHGIDNAVKIPAYLGKPLADIPDESLPDALRKIRALMKLDTETVTMMFDSVAELPDGTKAAEKEPEKAKEPAPPQTRAQFIEAMYRYALYADGTRDQSAMIHTQQDVPQILKKAFGTEKQSEVPDEKLGEAVRLVDEAIATDRFKRKRS